MKIIERVAAVDASTPRIAAILKGMPLREMLLMRLIRVVHTGMSANLDQLFRPFGFTEGSFHTLALVMASERGAISPSVLGELVGQTRANMTRILDSLLAKGYVSCSIDGNDARRKLVRITAAGKRQIALITPKLIRPAKLALSALSADEMTLLESLLRKLVQSLDQVERQAWSTS
jgi:MarR family transcriptional regulator, negative regulator of the multidrug operon emrRAB